MALARGPEDGVCAARDCQEVATLALEWSNPAIPHGRTKRWLTCEAHREELADWFRYRGFPVVVTPLERTTR